MTLRLDQALGPGERFHGYEIVDLVARGGRTFVYKALNEADETVALKISTVQLPTDEIERLRREFAPQAFVDHPNLERTLAAGVDDGRPWCATELLAGSSLEALLAESGPLPTERAVSLGAQMARGLEALHAHSLLYRNLKPSNALVLHDGTVKLLDVLLSTTARRDRPLSTPQTMSPEESSGSDLDVRADVYSLGALLFQLVTGRPPFDGTVEDMREGHLHRTAPRLRAVRPSAAALEAVINHALEKHPQNRYPSMAAMAQALDAAGQP
jgi:serine/threonine protein kinase